MSASSRASRTPRPSKPGRASGSRSAGHRGHQPAEPRTKKARWSAQERVARGLSADRRDRGGDDTTADQRRRPDWEPRTPTSRRNLERVSRHDRDDRPARRVQDDRAPRRGNSDRDYRGFTSDRDRTPRRDYEDRAPRRDYEDRAPRRDHEDRAPRRDYEERAPRRDFDDRAPRRNFEDRAPRREYEPRSGRRDFEERAPRRRDDERGERRDSSFRPERRSANNRTDRPDFEARAGRHDRFDRGQGRDNRDGYARSGRPEGARFDRADQFERRDRDSAPRFEPREDVVLERLEGNTVTAEDTDGVSFADLGLGQNICAQLASLGAERPFPIQAATIPDVIGGRDVLGRGRTGSGKTIAFGAPLVERLMALGGSKGRRPGRLPRALILAPTRELAMQIDRTVQPIARSVGLFTVTIVGGVPQHKQTAGLSRGVDIVIATPGRLEDLIDQGRADLSEVTITVLDEADHMCDLGFLEPVQRILRQVRPGSQRLLFSATLDRGVANLVDEFLTDPQVHQVQSEDDVTDIDHRVLVVDQREKTEVIRELVSGEGKTLVFARTRAFAEQVAEELSFSGVPAVSLHGDLNQAKRTRNLQHLASGRVRVLVATDVAARGIHVDDITLVVQADAPDEYKTYLHRAGRTGRAGKKGAVATLVTRARRRRMADLLQRAEIEAEEHMVRPGDRVIAQLAGTESDR